MIGRAARLTAVAAAAGALGALVLWCAEPGLVTAGMLARGRDPVSLDEVVDAGVSIAAVVAYATLMLTAAVTVVASLLGSRIAVAAARSGWSGPRWWQVVVLAACGLGLAAQSAQAAAPSHRPAGPPCAAACASGLDGLPYPDLPMTPAPPTAHSRHDAPSPAVPRAADSVRRTVTVAGGDSLWSIAVGLSPPGTSAAEVVHVVDRLYAANLREIGPDPDLVYPGTVLRIPGGPQ